MPYKEAILRIDKEEAKWQTHINSVPQACSTYIKVPVWVGAPSGNRSINVNELLINKRFDLVMEYSPENLPKFLNLIEKEYEEGNVTHEELVAILRKHNDFPGRNRLKQIGDQLLEAEALRHKIEKEKEEAKRLYELKTAEEIKKLHARVIEEVVIPLEEEAHMLRAIITSTLDTLEKTIVLPAPKTWRDDIKAIGKAAWKIANK